MSQTKVSNKRSVDLWEVAGQMMKADQEVSIEKEEDGTVWATVRHDDKEISLSFENLLKLKLLIHETAEEFSKKVK